MGFNKGDKQLTRQALAAGVRPQSVLVCIYIHPEELTAYKPV